MSPPARPTFEPGQAFTLPLWEARSQAWLLQQKADNPRMFRRGMQQQPLEDGEALFARGVEKFLRYGVKAVDLARPGAPTYGGFDPAGERRMGNALTAAALGEHVVITVPALDGSGATRTQRERLRVLVGVERWANQSRPGVSPYLTTAQRLAGEHARHRFECLMLESNATQGAISALTLTVDASIPFDHVTTGAKSKHSETEGLPGLATEMERGLWALTMDDAHGTHAPLRDHDPLCDCAWCALIGDVVAYPDPTRGEYDSLMSLLFCWTAIQRGRAPGESEHAVPGLVTPGGSWGIAEGSEGGFSLVR